MADTIMTATEVRDTAFESNFTISKIKNEFIEVAQKNHIWPFLGDELAEDLRLYMQAGFSPADADLDILIGWLKDSLAWFTRYEAIPELIIHLTNKGAQQPFTKDSQPVSIQRQQEILQDSALRKAQSLLDMVRTEIQYAQEQDSDKYSDWSSSVDQKSDIRIIGGILLSPGDETDTLTNDEYYQTN